MPLLRGTALSASPIPNESGLSVGVLPNGSIFDIAHEAGRTPHHGQPGARLAALWRDRAGPAAARRARPAEHLYCRLGGTRRFRRRCDRVVWAGETAGIRHRATLWLHPESEAWFWLVEADERRATQADVILVQDLGLGERGFLMNNEAYASQYIDHHIGRHADAGPVVMSRQNLAQGGRHPWAAHGCLDGAASFATDALQLFGPAYRDAGGIALAFRHGPAGPAPSA